MVLEKDEEFVEVRRGGSQASALGRNPVDGGNEREKVTA